MLALKPESEGAPDFADSSCSLRELPVEMSGERTVVRGFHGLAYSAAVVDLDPKPIAKMHHYYKLDKEVAEFYAAAVKNGTLKQ